MTQDYINSCNKLMEQGKYQEAINGFDFVLRMDPASVAAFAGMARCHAHLKNWQQALTAGLNALGHGGHRQVDLENFIAILKQSELQSYVGLIEDALKAALPYPLLEYAAIELLINQFSAKHQALFANPKMVFNAPLKKLLQDDSLCQIIQRTPVTDYTLEKMLLLGRKELLQQVVDGKDISPYWPFLSAMVSLRLLNDDLYSTDDAEQDLLNKLTQETDNCPIEVWLLRLNFATGAQTVAMWQQHQQALSAILTQAGLNHLIDDLTFHTQVSGGYGQSDNISQSTSKTVQSFYTENPYPKYRMVGVNTISIDQIFNQFDRQVNANAKVLIAGCGTGKQVINFAVSSPQTQIVAIDLSPVSLAYARLMAERYNIRNVEFKIFDILQVAELKDSFDYIISTGVLHHLESPQAGLNALNSVLKPDGLMYLGFYSSQVRKELVEIKNNVLDYLDTDEAGLTPVGVSRWRAQLAVQLTTQSTMQSTVQSTMQAPQRAWYQVDDFFSLNGLYDLLFHPQQAEYTPIELKTLLDNSGLNFEAMLIKPDAQAKYQAPLTANPLKDKATALVYWHKMEQLCPDLFIGMYSFYVSKAINQ